MAGTPKSFPRVVCWDLDSRPKVCDTVALRVEDSIFDATHSHIPLVRRNPITRDEVGMLQESQLLSEFTDPQKEHVFCVVGGDPGTGKSHLVKWVFKQLLAPRKGQPHRFHPVLVPRDSANLADVLKKVLHGFEGENIARIRKEIQATSSITTRGAMNNVLDQLAFVIDPHNRASTGLKFPQDEPHEIILGCLPAMLRDHAIRSHLMEDEKHGIVARLAKHVCGKQETARDDEHRWRWRETDLDFDPRTSDGAGTAAKELSTAFHADTALRRTAAEVLNQALNEALPRLVGLLRGSLKEALFEIRRNLRKADKDLVLLIEDLSVMQGVDNELVEALQTSRADSGRDLCVLRSMVGVTPDDMARFYENIKERIDLAVELRLPLSAPALGDTFVLEFASRYLNAARHSPKELDDWSQSRNVDEELPSYCRRVGCPNITECHDVFGSVEDIGLYPFTRESLMRLYGYQAETGDHDTRTQKAFNPRLLVGRVLKEFLAQAEVSIEDGDFPSEQMLSWFRLMPGPGSKKQLSVQQQDEMDNDYGAAESRRVQGLVEIYSVQPRQSQVNKRLAEILGVDITPKNAADPSATRREAEEAKGTPPSRVQPLPQTDEFDEWSTSKVVRQARLTDWRRALYSAIRGARDWDAEPCASLFFDSTLFSATHISFEGQSTSSQRKGGVLEVKASPHNAIALRGLVSGDVSAHLTKLLYALKLVDELSGELHRKLTAMTAHSGPHKPMEVAIELLLTGAAVGGRLDLKPTREQIVDSLFVTEEPMPPPSSGGAIATESLTRAWHQVRTALDSDELRLARTWFLKSLSARKGGNTEAGVINGLVLGERAEPTFRRAPRILTGVDVAAWDPDLYKPLIQLIGRLEGKIAPALEAETKALKEWMADVERVLGAPPHEPKLREVSVAVRKGIAEDVIRDPQAAEAVDLIDAKGTEIAEVARLVGQLLEDGNAMRQFVLIGKIDAALVKRTADALPKLERALDKGLALLLSQRKGQEDVAAETRIRDLGQELKKLEEALVSLA